MSAIDKHPILGQLKESDRLLNDVAKLQTAVKERSRIMERDGKITTVISGIIGISGLFFMNQLPFFIILGLLVVGLPVLWIHLGKEAREFTISDDEIREAIKK
ncbi:MAG: hypothetical protein U9Q77_07705 [Candidatus Marinimicrobia bacterium]|nr:hypothetical protein [Candidatus Neomarinimicrobiota bacterium]